MHYNELVNFYAVYSFVDGNVIRVKSALCMNWMFSGGIYIAPGGTGIIRHLNSGILNHYDKLEFYGSVITRIVSGDTSPTADSFRVNSSPVTQDEFEYIFGCPDDRIWLTLHEITETNMRSIIVVTLQKGLIRLSPPPLAGGDSGRFSR